MKELDRLQGLLGVSSNQEDNKALPDQASDKNLKDFKADIIDALSKLMNIHASSGEPFRAMGYRRAITNIKAYKGPITKV